jgi:hypothetical protein
LRTRSRFAKSDVRNAKRSPRRMNDKKGRKNDDKLQNLPVPFLLVALSSIYFSFFK